MDVAVSGEDGEAGDLVQWPPLEIEYRLLDGQTGRIVDSEPIVRWRPDDVAHLALFWLSVSAADRAGPDEILHVPTDATAQEWLSSVTDRKAHLATSSIKLPPEGCNMPSLPSTSRCANISAQPAALKGSQLPF